MVDVGGELFFRVTADIDFFAIERVLLGKRILMLKKIE